MIFILVLYCHGNRFKIMKVKISVVVPIYNEEGNIEILYSKLKQTLQKIDNNFEIIFINDGSIDNSYVLLKNRKR